MVVAVLGTGMVGQAHAERMAELGHEVTIGTRSVKKALARMEPGRMTEPFGVWAKKHKTVKVAAFSDAARHSEHIINALSGQAALKVLKSLRSELAGKVLVDISNPLDFSSGELKLFFVNDDSLGEQIQKALPATYVVKAFNTMNATVQVNPKSVASGDHHLFVAGNDKKAKAEVAKLAKSYGWKNIVDLGDIKSARGMEMILPIWVNLFGIMGTAQFNFKIVE
ncbi:NADP oxidoreductase [Candidatus Saccharibacteria bacterium RIFCSPHIGHO2_12_FULL_49_19]|nr:MAG: NADP oxidoreductase [Candidatus Saccharibacteria bacterium RIFCSPHIGHO2_01_FULL_49_21]OGL36350.1 MAG: NADP oxidoreductase [Candidatus Saccharibacteria bacterium RIFCSPHIGHO2_12_FULL_49_19]OGL37244.1 MAG: NADP oxidoreductase [Candidatus Saccharibacteria bacterium RIFCSPLOWO2_01_FULL_49_22]